MPLELRMAEGKDDAIRVFQAYQQMHAEGGIPGTFHALKTLTNVLRLVNGPGSCVMMALDGADLAGVLSLYEEAHWWSEDRFLGDKGFYILPQFRDGQACELLMNAAAQLGDDLGVPVFLTIFNAKRKRGGRSKWERAGATLGFTNRGAVIAHIPET